MINDPEVSNNISVLTNEIKTHLKSQRRVQKIKTIAIVLGICAYLGTVAYGLSPAPTDPTKSYANVVRIDGEIGLKKEASLGNLEDSLIKAYEDKEAKGVVLVINSPGGSPVQSAMLHDKIVMLKKKHEKKTYVVGEDMLTSGAYLIAVAGDEIYVDNSTIAGSIGVVSRGFGFPEVMKKIGIENRTTTAGENKARSDAFSEVNEADQEKLKGILTKLHTHFINIVKTGRGDRLKKDVDVFTGDFWTGDESVELGLVDGVGNLDYVLNDKLKADTAREIARPVGLREMLLTGLGSAMGSGFKEALNLEEMSETRIEARQR